MSAIAIALAGLALLGALNFWLAWKCSSALLMLSRMLEQETLQRVTENTEIVKGMLVILRMVRKRPVPPRDFDDAILH